MSIIFRGDRIVTTAGVAYDSGRYFLARREAGGAQSRKWEFPGGKCDEGDGDERACLIREFFEELNIPVDVGAEIGTVPFEHNSIPYLLVAYHIILSAKPTTLTVHTESGWFLPEEIELLDLADSDRILVEQYLRLQPEK